MSVYKRVMLKLSGEALKSGNELFDFAKIQQMAGIIRDMHEVTPEIGIVIGAGNIWRGRQGPSANMDAGHLLDLGKIEKFIPGLECFS